jgi:hypothetical protein
MVCAEVSGVKCMELLLKGRMRRWRKVDIVVEDVRSGVKRKRDTKRNLVVG